MQFTTSQSRLSGTVRIPGSKSHTIRAVAMGALADGKSVIREPLISKDALSARIGYAALGATITGDDSAWSVTGFDGKPTATMPTVDIGNSGTSMNMLLGSAALLQDGAIELTGDYQIQRRPSLHLASALRSLGADITSVNDNGCPPFLVKGGFSGGTCEVNCLSSQYVSSVLVNAPLAPNDTLINVVNPNELPYIDITLWWLDKLGIRYERNGYDSFRVPGNQRYAPFDLAIPGDFSTATFFLCGGAICDGDTLVTGIDLSDPQGDKAVIDYLKAMGATIDITDQGVRVTHSQLKGTELDLNATPDALPMMAVTACFADGTTRIRNVAQARIKETDRIKVMAENLTQLGAKVEELEDGLVIEGRSLQSGTVPGHDDHRIVMAFAMAGLAGKNPITVTTAEAAAVTVPEFKSMIETLGGDIAVVN